MASLYHSMLMLIIGFSATTTFADTMYKSIGPDGKVVYSDRPPVEGRIEKTITFENLPSSALPKQAASYVEQLKRLRASAPVVASRESTVLYSATWCGYCAKAKAYLAGKGISYEEIDIDTNEGKASFAQAGGGKGVPLLLARGQRVQGFSTAAYDKLFSSRK
ncbi:glutaredoxin family protein [Azoarcus sp. L1K30]|uniref:glutaredoxin family protein n=1 Tax=Azoarcus sp. L1K30 TaxID=2820277 RepID=UPI001B8363D0|nr:glutaredoxin family protein [Azoarcus sp. L1K30]MBR0566891.1 glutaredoxin family protein [Azoarcus sp. L1K30]